jgi:hypothetical protein
LRTWNRHECLYFDGLAIFGTPGTVCSEQLGRVIPRLDCEPQLSGAGKQQDGLHAEATFVLKDRSHQFYLKRFFCNYREAAADICPCLWLWTKSFGDKKHNWRGEFWGGLAAGICAFQIRTCTLLVAKRNQGGESRPALFPTGAV